MREDVEASEVHLTAVEQVKGTGFQPQFVRQVDVVALPVDHINTGWNVSTLA
jgi:hypothetical protein